MDKKDKALEYLRNLEKLKASGVKSEDYTSDLDKDVVRVKGRSPVAEKPTVIKNTTQKIDNSAQKLLSGSEHAKKIASLLGKRGLKALPIIGTIAGLASAGEKAYAGDMEGAKDEVLSAADPTGISDAILLTKDVADAKLDTDTRSEMVRANINAMKNYKKSGAYRDARGITEEEQDIEELSKPKQNKFSRLSKLFGE